jgi:hypothetical protein
VLVLVLVLMLMLVLVLVLIPSTTQHLPSRLRGFA